MVTFRETKTPVGCRALVQPTSPNASTQLRFPGVPGGQERHDPFPTLGANP